LVLSKTIPAPSKTVLAPSKSIPVPSKTVLATFIFQKQPNNTKKETIPVKKPKTINQLQVKPLLKILFF